jgi:hypothetical protein
VSVTARSPFAVCNGPGCHREARWPGSGRSDRRYCSNACRQRAFRQRQNSEVSRQREGLSAAVESHASANGALYDRPDAYCAHLPGAECRWTPSCNADGCWRVECAASGRDLFGIGPNVANGGGV